MEENGILALVTNPGALPDKRAIMESVAALAARYENADGNVLLHPLRDLIVLKELELFVKEALKVCMPWAVQEAKQYDEKERKCLHNAKVVVKPGSPTYDFSGNSEWVSLKQEEDAYTEEAKMAANRRKAVEKNLILAHMAEVTEECKESVAVTIL